MTYAPRGLTLREHLQWNLRTSSGICVRTHTNPISTAHESYLKPNVGHVGAKRIHFFDPGTRIALPVEFPRGQIKFWNIVDEATVTVLDPRIGICCSICRSKERVRQFSTIATVTNGLICPWLLSLGDILFSGLGDRTLEAIDISGRE